MLRGMEFAGYIFFSNFAIEISNEVNLLMKYQIWLIFILFLSVAGCRSDTPEDTRLLDIAENVSDSPQEMLARLDSIDVGTLKEGDRYLHALLCVKAQDKAYVRHKSDSVILKVIDYYSRHKGSGRYPEALYYGGRVYSDIGDAPSALCYFQDALDIVSEDADIDLYGRILSQIGFLLNSLRLYRESDAYIQETIRLLKQKSDDIDSIILMRQIQLSGAINLHAENYEKADSCFHEARRIGRQILHKDTTIHDMYLAGIELYRSDVNKALKIIRRVIGCNPTERLDIIRAYASKIYFEAGIFDTAHIYAVKLIRCDNNDYRKIGYSILLHPALRKYSDPDSLMSYALEYGDVLDEYLNRHDAQQVVMQTSLYNYQIHERERMKAEEAKRNYMYLAGISLIMILVLIAALLYVRIRSIRTILQYRKALDDLTHLRETLDTESNNRPDESIRNNEKSAQNKIKKGMYSQYSGKKTLGCKEPQWNEPSKAKNEKNALRECLKEELLGLQKAGIAKKGDAKDILGLSIYERLKLYIEENKCIPETNDIWQEVEGVVKGLSPEFKKRLYLLTGSRLKEDAYRMALLIRCGLKPTEVAILLGRSKGALSSRRGYICEMIFGEKLGVKVMDDIIWLL